MYITLKNKRLNAMIAMACRTRRSLCLGLHFGL